MTERPLLLDLYCCAGGASTGYVDAGFDVIGVDIAARPNYPFAFVKADALMILGEMAANNGVFTVKAGYGGWTFYRPLVVHSSPPCQADNPQTKGSNRGRPNSHKSWTAGTRTALDALGLPYVIEQPAGSGQIREDLMLCMDMFKDQIGPPPWVFRHRLFELSGFTVPRPAHSKHVGRVRGWRHGEYFPGNYVAGYGTGGGKATISEMEHAMGIDWPMERSEMVESIPRAYTRYIGGHLLASLI